MKFSGGNKGNAVYDTEMKSQVLQIAQIILNLAKIHPTKYQSVMAWGWKQLLNFSKEETV